MTTLVLAPFVGYPIVFTYNNICKKPVLVSKATSTECLEEFQTHQRLHRFISTSTFLFKALCVVTCLCFYVNFFLTSHSDSI